LIRCVVTKTLLEFLAGAPEEESDLLAILWPESRSRQQLGWNGVLRIYSARVDAPLVDCPTDITIRLEGAQIDRGGRLVLGEAGQRWAEKVCIGDEDLFAEVREAGGGRTESVRPSDQDFNEVELVQPLGRADVRNFRTRDSPPPGDPNVDPVPSDSAWGLAHPPGQPPYPGGRTDVSDSPSGGGASRVLDKSPGPRESPVLLHGRAIRVRQLDLEDGRRRPQETQSVRRAEVVLRYDTGLNCTVHLALPTEDAPGLRVTFSPRSKGTEFALPVTLADPSLHSARVDSLIDQSRLDSATVCIVGVGSGGGRVAWELAKAGISNFELIDDDRLEPVNLSRHVLDWQDLGRLKVEAVRDRIIQANPRARVAIHAFDVLNEPARTRVALKKASILVAASGSPQSYFFLNELALSLRVPAVYSAAFGNAAAGFVLRVVPGTDPCYNCVHGALIRAEDRLPDRLPDYNHPQLGQELRAEPGLAVDIGMISLLHAKIILTTLHAVSNSRVPDPRVPSALPESTLEKDSGRIPTMVLWVGQKIMVGIPEADDDLVPNWNYLLWTNRDFKQWGPFESIRSFAVRRPDCVACGVADTAR
jgi:molybdopterin/thiamine biosynthesis adenylyltransferase